MELILFSKKRSNGKIVKKGPEGEELLEEKSLMDRKMEKKLNKKTMLKSLNKKLITVQNFLLMMTICENMA